MTKPAPKKRVAWLVVDRKGAAWRGGWRLKDAVEDQVMLQLQADAWHSYRPFSVVRVEYPWPPSTERKRRKP